MKHRSRVLAAGLVVAAAVLIPSSLAARVSREVIVCGWDEVYILDLKATPPAKVWSWKAAGQPEFPEILKAFNRHQLAGRRLLSTCLPPCGQYVHSAAEGAL